MKKLLVAVVVTWVLLAPVSLVLMVTVTASAASSDCGPAGTGRDVSGTHVSAEQLANAQAIVHVARSLNLPPYAAVIAIATAKAESDLHNDLVRRDHDSIGLFQQRVSVDGADVAGDPVKAATRFFGRLVRVADWATRPLAQTADAVQRSAIPSRVSRWVGLATAVVTRLWSGAVTTSCTGNVNAADVGGGGVPAGYQLPTEAQARIAVQFALAQLDKRYVFGAEGPDTWDCSGLVQRAWAAAGVALPRTSSQQAHAGVPVVGLAEMQPGDLIFIPGSDGTAKAPGHVGMYIGPGGDGRQYLVQAPQSGDVVKVSPVSGWSRKIVAIRRPVVRA